MQTLVSPGLPISKASPHWRYGSTLKWSVVAVLQDKHRLSTTAPLWKHKAPLPSPPPAYAPGKSRSSSMLDRHRIVLPETRKGKKAMQKATSFWREQMTEHGHGNIQPSGPLTLAIDFHPSAKVTKVASDSIIFAGHHPLGQELWRISKWKRSRVIKYLVYGSLIYYGVLFLLWIRNQEEEPITGRRRFNWTSHAKAIELIERARLEHEAGLDKLRKCIFPPSDPTYGVVQSTLARLTTAAGLDDIDWEISLVNAPTVINATVLPTGQVLVFSGIFKAITNDDELAAVLSHEISHVIAQHGMEAQSNFSLRSWILTPFFPVFIGLSWGFLELAIIALPPAAVLGVIALYLSRNREREADYIGMLLMSEAGFDPKGAVSIWRNMEKAREALMQANPDLRVPVELLSSHPHDAARIQQNLEWVPEILHMTGRAPDSVIEPTSTLTEKKRKWQKFLNDKHQPKLSPI